MTASRSPQRHLRPRRRAAVTTSLLGVLFLLVAHAAPPELNQARALAAREFPDHGVWPLAPAPIVERRFAPPSSPWLRGHRGADLRGHQGQNVRATLPGTVAFVGSIASRDVVSIDHGWFTTTYEPVSSELEVGAPVGRGAQIGQLQGMGSHCAPLACLHWGLRVGQARPRQYADPLALVGCQPKPVRLFGSVEQAIREVPAVCRQRLAPLPPAGQLRDALITLAGVLAGRPPAGVRR